MRSLFIIAVIVSSFSFQSFANPKIKNQKIKTTKQVMNDVFQSFVNLLPYASSEIKFRDPNSEEYIIGNLNKLNQAFRNAKHLSSFKAPGFKPSYDVIKEHVAGTIDAFNGNNKIFARTRLKATMQICMSCHTQLPGNRLSSSFRAINTIGRGDFPSDFEYAEFQFLIRKWSRAAKYYESEIAERIKKNNELKKIHNTSQAHYIDFTIENSLKRLITIYTKINYSPDKALAIISRYETKEGVSQKNRDMLANWKDSLNNWKKKKFNGKITGKSDLARFIKTNLSPLEGEAVGDGSQDITLLITSGVLYRYMNKYPGSESVPEMLYWLSVVDKQLNYSYFYSLSDIYLKECIKKYSKNPYAKKCYKRYEDNIIFGFSGSSGVNIPSEEREELKELKAYLKN